MTQCAPKAWWAEATQQFRPILTYALEICDDRRNTYTVTVVH